MEVLDITLRSGKMIFLNIIDIDLQELNRKYYEEFSDCFKEIPHIHQLLTNIYYCIKLKDLFLIFTVRTYSYSQKLQSVWKILI